MEELNQTFPDRFILLGLSDIPYLQGICFVVFLLMYIMTLSGNVLLIIVVRINPKLQTPMYFFLSNLSVIDICFSSTIVPKILMNTLATDKSISLLGCAVQMYFHQALGSAECIILSIMAYDRFAAICRPLHYITIMSRMLCVNLAVGSWSVCLLIPVILVVFTFQLPYCKTHVNHFFCEMPPFFRLACRDTLLNEIAMYIAAGIAALCSFCLTLISYIHIISTILKIRSSQGRLKAFSTCASHLTVVVLYYGTIVFVYLRPRSIYSAEIDKSVSILYKAVTPMLNPIIYSMRNKEVINTINIYNKQKALMEKAHLGQYILTFSLCVRKKQKV